MMLGWMIVFMFFGMIVGSLLVGSSINESLKAGVIERRGRIYRITDITDKLPEVKDDHAK